jgi:hypothetical protein
VSQNNRLAIEWSAVQDMATGNPWPGVQEALAGFRECSYKVIVYEDNCRGHAPITFELWLRKHNIPYDEFENGLPIDCVLYVDYNTFRFTGDWKRDEFRVYAIMATPRRAPYPWQLKAGWNGDRFEIKLVSNFSALLVLSLTAKEWNAMKQVAKEGMDQEWRTISEDFTNIEKPNGEP